MKFMELEYVKGLFRASEEMANVDEIKIAWEFNRRYYLISSPDGWEDYSEFPFWMNEFVIAENATYFVGNPDLEDSSIEALLNKFIEDYLDALEGVKEIC